MAEGARAWESKGRVGGAEDMEGSWPGWTVPGGIRLQRRGKEQT